jgi:hypothetical protein
MTRTRRIDVRQEEGEVRCQELPCQRKEGQADRKASCPAKAKSFIRTNPGKLALSPLTLGPEEIDPNPLPTFEKALAKSGLENPR